jgi:hypothetical protein
MRACLKSGFLVLVFAALAAVAPSRALADEWPMASGDFWEMTAVHLKDGGALACTSFIAAEWKADQEFAKSKGWIKGYTVLSNVHGRKGEPDLYLVVISERLASGPEAEKRDAEYTAWKKKTQAQMQKESGNRLEMRELGSSTLLQELKFRK